MVGRRGRELPAVFATAVVEEASGGNPQADAKRLKALERTEELEVTPAARALAEDLVVKKAIPKKADTDALHLSIAALNGLHFLLRCNFAHIANANTLDLIEKVCRENGNEPPCICTSEELMG